MQVKRFSFLYAERKEIEYMKVRWYNVVIDISLVGRGNKQANFCVTVVIIGITTINPGTVCAWFMLGMVLRRSILVAIFNRTINAKPIPPGTRVPEDIKRRGPHEEVSKTEPSPIEFTTDMRVNKTITNDSENDTYFLIILLATTVFSNTPSGSATRTIVYGVLYLFIRICYVVAYIKALQPWRTTLFALGLTCTVACNLDLVITMSRRPN